jgi:hypothetical protein
MLSSINEKIPSLKAISIDSIKDLESQPHEYSLLKQGDSTNQPIEQEVGLEQLFVPLDFIPRQSIHLHAPFGKTASLPQKSRRTSRQQSKKPWRAKKLPTDWKYLAQQPGWALLSEDEQMQLMLGWPNRHFCLSYQEIADCLGKSIYAAMRKIKKWGRQEELKKKKNFLERRGKVTGIHRRNHYVFTEKRKKELEAIVKKLFKDSNQTALRKDSSIEEDFCQANRDNSAEEKIFEGRETIEFAEDKDYHKFLEAKLDQLLAEEEPLKPEIKTIFGMSGFGSHISTIASWLKKEINSRPVKELVANLKWHEKKRKKGYRIKNFWASFVWRMKLGKDPVSWMTKRANDYQAAISGLKPNGTETYAKENNLMLGIDSRAVVEQIIELQKKTGMQASKRDLHGLLCHGASHLSSFLKVVLFKAKRGAIKNWIGYAHFLAKKSLVELSNMYKSEDQIQAKRDAEEALIRGAKNLRIVSDWQKLLGDLEENDRVLATGTGGEIWD